MDQLEKMMKENKEFFSDAQPAEGHYERFERRLQQQQSRQKTIRIGWQVSRIAAVGILVIMSGLWVSSQFNNNQSSIPLGAVNSEYQQVEYYYTTQIASQVDQLEKSEWIADPEYKKAMIQEVEAMDSIYQALQEELGANPDDERIIQAMIQHYQTKLQVIQNILTRVQQINEINNQNIQENENESFEL